MQADPNDSSKTSDWNASQSQGEDPSGIELPDRIGRYVIERILGSGGFGVVYLALDEELDRRVALKAPHRTGMVSSESTISEARIVASLDHPHIVPVYDVGRLPDQSIYIVSKFIEGTDLREHLATNRMSHAESARLLVLVSEAVQCAHEHGLVHRDIKPSNILLDHQRHPFLADFGLAVRDVDLELSEVKVGTPAYMSPEQVRAEGHRVDGRSDIFSLGVVMYEMLTGRRPFPGNSAAKIFQQVTTAEVRPLRQYDRAIPREFERICLKCLAKRAADRYASAADLALELAEALRRSVPTGFAAPGEDRTADSASHSGQTPGLSDTHVAPVRVVPKGLRSFDAHDADFFLKLLPGPFDRYGLPESVRFWKDRMEETRLDSTSFSVGVVYGPSGCGKSSLMKAGILPRLATHVTRIYLEASSQDTEERLSRGLFREFPHLQNTRDLATALAHLRRGEGLQAQQKVLIVIDQFEQWLHGRHGLGDNELTRALRQCDGVRVQCVLMVRDDFWLGLSRLMRELEVPLVEGHNSALVDLFAIEHARKVLIAFGRGFGQLPEDHVPLSDEQNRFLDEAIGELATEDKVVSVRLALFAEMLKAKPWTMATLRQVGGAEGVGANFLEETFSASTAPPLWRLHQAAARQTLEALMPDQGTDIKGQRRTRDELAEVAGYAAGSSRFEELLRVLDSETRLITPTEEADTSDSASEPGAYQLTHDFLVPSLRTWLGRKKQETRQGRAELRLAERASLWALKPESRHLPTLSESLRIDLLTERRHWNETQRAMMAKARRFHLLRALLLSLLVVAVSLAGWQFRKYLMRQSREAEVAAQVQRLIDAAIGQTPTIIAELSRDDPSLVARLRESVARDDIGERGRTSLRLALLPSDAEQVTPIVDRLLRGDPDEFVVLGNSLHPHREAVVDILWKRLLHADSADPSAARLAAAAALARFAPEDARWSEAASIARDQLLAVDPLFLHFWLEQFDPVAPQLLEPLAEVYRDDREDRAPQRRQATLALRRFARTDARFMLELFLDADREQFTHMLPLVTRLGPEAVPFLRQSLDHAADSSDVELGDSEAARQLAVYGGHTDQAAFCQGLDKDYLDDVVQLLSDRGYRLNRLRPYYEGEQLKLSGTWVRDSAEAQFSLGLTADQLREQTRQRESERWLLEDVAVYVLPAGESNVHYAACWKRVPQGPLPSVRLILVDDIRKVEAELDTSNKEGVRSFQAACTGSLRSAFAVLLRGDHASTTATWQDELPPDRLPVDIGLGSWDAGHAASQLATANRVLAAGESLNYRIYRAEAYLRNGEYDKAQADLDVLQSHDQPQSIHWQTRAWSEQAGEVSVEDDSEHGRVAVIHNQVPGATMWRQNVDVEPYRKYLLCGWIKTDAVRSVSERQLGASLMSTLPYQYTPGLEGTHDWTYQAVVLESRNERVLRVGMALGAHTRFAEGKASFAKLQMVVLRDDDLQSEELFEPAFLTRRARRNLLLNTSFQRPQEVDRLQVQLLAVSSGADAAQQALDNASQIDAPQRHVLQSLIEVAGDSVDWEPSKWQAWETTGDDAEERLAAARALAEFAWAAEATSRNPEPYAREAVKALEQAWEFGLNQASAVRADRCFDILLSRADFRRFLRKLPPDLLLIGAWQASDPQPSRVLTGMLPHRHLTAARELLKEGYHPVSIAASRTGGEQRLVVGSAWQRHARTEEETHLQSARQANAAAGLLILGQFDSEWLQRADPHLASYLIRRAQLNPLDTASLVELLDQTDTSLKRYGVLLMLAGIPAPPQDSALRERIAQVYTSDPDPGVHAAARFALQAWGAAQTVRRLDDELAEKSDPQRRWEVNSQRQTLARFAGPLEFLMGDSTRGLRQSERAHLQRLPRSFAIATTEVTVEQFARFQQATGIGPKTLNTPVNAEMDCPIVEVTWFEAAAYCRWLSEQEEYADDQMCYPAVDQIGPAMRLPLNFLHRRGYRLPTEAEWEYACRAGSTTPQSFGSGNELLTRYACCFLNSDGNTRPVASFLPNSFGLFDCYGNVTEWCQSRFLFPRPALRGLPNEDLSVDSRPQGLLLLRGGAVSSHLEQLTSFRRIGDQPAARFITHGFRIARTIETTAP